MRKRKDFAAFGKPISAESLKEDGSFCISSGGEGQIYLVSGRGAAAIGIRSSREGQMYLISGKGSAANAPEYKTAAVIERDGEEIRVAVPSDEYGGAICFECNIINTLGKNFIKGDILYPKFEKTGGAVMFTEKDGERKYLLIKNESGHIGFPKGHIEYGETEEETAAREVREETGLDFVKFGDFREEYTYTTRENMIKTGVFFISHYDYRPPRIQHEEILDDWLLGYAQAMEKLNFPEDRDLLEKADRYINSRE